MNRPMTSPWSRRLDLLADDHLDAVSLRLRLERAGDLVVIGDGDRSETPGPRLGEQHLDRRGAVVGMVGVHVQVDVDQGTGGQLAPELGHAAAVVTTRDELAVHLLELVGQPRPAQRRAQRLGRRHEALPVSGSVSSRSRWAASV